MSYDLKSETDVKDYLENLGIEYRFGCYSEKKPEVCHLLGDYLESIKKDFDKAAKVYRSNCDDYGYARSCLKYGNYSFLGKGRASDNGDPVKAYSYYEKGCGLNDPDACLHSGLLLVSKSVPKELKRDVPKAFEFLKKSCEMNNGNACFYLSGMHISGILKDEYNVPKVKEALEQKEKSSPGKAASLPATAYVVERDMQKAFEFAYKACELRNMYACANLSQMYAKGDGIAKDEKKAEKYKKLAMEMQDEIKKQQQLTFQQGLNPT
ncbi:cytochrome c oxidase assembly factor 7 homolog [Toxorhynchites rutilus septentrionalis]|uniref:cytochrome c oxidase assembly factor 7 homolog n=1 Tax=Toxorhynchites rutilus septentrionalis TaxID=329112 RepID=UPI002478CC67|nr:cytochrome c oxidase assembly factor 7 homolog [Toxorhynchites rutilus septentrionalis]